MQRSEKMKVLVAALSVVMVLCGVIVAATRRTQTRQVVPEAPVPVVRAPVSWDIELPSAPPAAETQPGKPAEKTQPGKLAEKTQPGKPAEKTKPGKPVEKTQPGKPLRAKVAQNESGTVIVVDKGDYTLEVFHDGEPVKQYGIAVGKNPGDKKRIGDMRTPEGEFPIIQIQNASTWGHDFGDGKGWIKGAYGPFFIRLDASPWKGIGIHGTHAPSSIGTNVSEGCIRLKNDDIAELRRLVKVGDKVVIRN